MKRFLFVCTGNTCRSPLAQALLLHKHPNLEAKSAGVSALAGMNASEGSVEVLQEKGIKLNHTSNQVNEQLLAWADIVLTLTAGHKKLLVKQYPSYVDKIYTLKEFALQDEVQEKLTLLDERYAQLELKQARFLTEHKDKINELNSRNDALAKQELQLLTNELYELIKDDRKAIEAIEKELPSFDISDPFGGSTEVYRKTAQEIEAAIDKILEKL